MKRFQFFILLTWLVVILLHGCSPTEPSQTSTTTSPTEALLFSRYVSIGDNVAAGYQSAALTKKHQDYSYPALIARQTDIPEYNIETKARFVQPLLAYPGLGGESLSGFGILELIYLDNPFTPLTVNPDPVILPVPFSDYPDFKPLVNPYYSDEIRNYPLPYSNLAIPGIFVEDILTAKTAAASASKSQLINVVLRGIGFTVFEQAKVFTPSIITCWAGTWDVLGYARGGGADPLFTRPTPVNEFSTAYAELIDSLSVIVPKLNDIQPSLFAANIPDILTAPYFNTIPPYVIDTLTNALYLDGSNNPVPLVGVNPATDKILSSASMEFRKGTGIPAGILHGTGEALGDRFILDEGEQALIKDAIAGYNNAIAGICYSRQIPFVDMYALYNEISETGYHVAGFTFNAKMITGGFYSLDGLHPTDMGNAILANAWIDKVNNYLRLSVPKIDITKLGRDLELAGN